MEPTQKALKPCPFCGHQPAWISKDMANGTGASGMEAPMRALGCINKDCEVQPHTKFRNTENWEQGVGYFKVDYDKIAIKHWEHRNGIS